MHTDWLYFYFDRYKRTDQTVEIMRKNKQKTNTRDRTERHFKDNTNTNHQTGEICLSCLDTCMTGVQSSKPGTLTYSGGCGGVYRYPGPG